jgi:CHASE2 domain-containing sensor protein
MERTRKSLYYLAGYLIAGGVALLLAPDPTLKFLLSNGTYGEVFPRLAGMFASGLGMSIAGVIRARAEAQYTGTLLVRTYFVVCLVSFYWMTRDPLFLLVLGVVLVGVALTLTCYLLDRAQRA